MAGWIGGVVTSFAIRPAYRRRIGEAPRERAPWPEPTVRSRQWSVRYALTAYVVSFVGVNALAAVLYFGFGVRPRVGVGVLMVDAGLLASLLPLRRRWGLSARDLGLRAAPAGRSVVLAVVALVVYALIAGVWIATVHPHSPANTLAGVRNQSTVNVVLAIVAIAVSAPIVEEIFFRGLLYRSLRNQLSILPAALIAGALFGLVHITSYPLATLPVKAAFGVITCLLYERTGSLLPGIGLHSFVDASAIDVALTGNDWIVLAGFSALILVLLIRTVFPGTSKEARPVQVAALGDQHDDLEAKPHPPATVQMTREN
jgi:membrane protease YdiL (CAAX protease family)